MFCVQADAKSSAVKIAENTIIFDFFINPPKILNKINSLENILCGNRFRRIFSFAADFENH